MHINELPDAVLSRIFHWAINDPAYPPSADSTIKTWGTKLALLPVCRAWRELALPCVHRVSFIQCTYIDRPEDEDSSAIYDLDYSDAESDLSDWDDRTYKICVAKSNLDIIGNAGNGIWPRTIQLFIRVSDDHAHHFQHISEKISNHTISLGKVATMELYEESEDLSILEYGKKCVGKSSIGEEFSQLMPHVQHIKFGNHTTSDAFVNFAQSLVKGYAHQLTVFEGPQYALEKVQSFSDNLRYASIDGTIGTTYMPQMCAENLTKLALNDVSISVDWSSFESDGRSKSLHFANLKWLKLGVNFGHNDAYRGTHEMRYPPHRFNYTVIAPRLETVILQLCPFTLSFLASIYGLATIPNVELELYCANVYFTEFTLNRTWDKLAGYANYSQDVVKEMDDIAYINDMFSIHGLAESSKVEILNDGLLDFERIDWEFLLNIEIHCLLHFSDLKTLVSKAPRLETIYVSKIKVKVNGKLLPEIQDEIATVELLSPSLKSISFGDLIGCTKSERDKFIIYLSKLTLRD